MNMPTPLRKRTLTFYGPVDLPHTNNFRIALCQMINEGAEEITILFASPGGSTDDGIALFTFLQSLPVRLTMHAVGVVGSMAIPVFLSAPVRIGSINSRFYFHDYIWNFSTQVVPRIMADEASILLENSLDWTKTILNETTKLNEAELGNMRLLKEPYIMNPPDAIKYGLIQSIAEPSLTMADHPRVVV